MIIFQPENLEEELKKALEVCEKITGLSAEDLSQELPSNNDLTADDSVDYIISEETAIPVSLPRCSDDWIITYRQLIDWLCELEKSQLVDNVECWTSTRCLFRVGAQFDEHLRLVRKMDRGKLSDLEGTIAFTVEAEGRIFECLLRSGLTLFGFLVVAHGTYEKFFPPVLDDDLFVEIVYPQGTDRTVVRSIVSALLFEISSSIGIDLQPAPRPELYVVDEGENENPAPLPVGRLRPLLLGKGLPELLKLYSEATAVGDPGLKIVMYTKVIEFVAQTVVRTNTTELIRKKLLTPRGLDPDAAFIQELQESFESLRSFKKDSEAMRSAIEIACDVDSIAGLAPLFLKDLKKLSRKSSDEDRAKALTSFAISLIDTRNSIVHAKPNYKTTGNECPTAQLYDFAVLAKKAAQQAVRWFHGRPEHQRIC